MPDPRDRSTIEAELHALQRRRHDGGQYDDPAVNRQIEALWRELNALGVEGPAR